MMHSAIAVYAAEREAGLEQQIKEKSSIAIACPVALDSRLLSAVAKTDYKTNAKQLVEQALATNANQFDLHYLHTILTTTGWNRNDDVFDRYETWAARHTPEDKPFNFQHNPRKIIGHITGSCVVNDEYDLVDDNCVVDELPEKFHILTSAVLYKHLSSKDETLEEETKELLQEIASGKWMVSMEVLFAGFDYAVVTPDGMGHVVARNNESAFLTKHLRAYGGNGQYEGYRVGRMMRSLAFSGKGLVDDPGNPESYIFNDVTMFEGLVAAFNKRDGLVTASRPIVISTNQSDKKEETTMADTISTPTPVAQVSEVQWAEAQREIAALRDRLTKMDEEKVEAEFASLRGQIEKLEKTVADKDTELDNARKSKAEAEKSLTDAQAEHDKTKTELTEAQSKLDEISSAAKVTERVSQLVDKGVEKADAEKIVAKFDGVNDDLFEEVVATQAELVQTRAEMDDKAKKKKEDEKKKKGKPFGKSDASADDDEGAAAADAAAEEALNGAEGEEGAALAANEDGEDEDAELTSALAGFFGEALGNDGGPEQEGGK